MRPSVQICMNKSVKYMNEYSLGRSCKYLKPIFSVIAIKSSFLKVGVSILLANKI